MTQSDSNIVDSLNGVIEKQDSNSTIEIIFLLLSVWPFWLLVLIAGFVIYFRKEIRILIPSIKKVKTPLISFEGAAVIESIGKERSLSADTPKAETAKEESEDQKSKEIPESEDSEDIYKVFDLMKQGNSNEAHELYRKLQLQTESESERKKDQALFIFYQFRCGVATAEKELRNLIAGLGESNERSFAQSLLAEALFEAGFHMKAKQAYEEALSFRTSDLRTRMNLIGIANCVLTLTSLETAISFLKENVSELKEEANKAQVYKWIGYNLKLKGDYLFAFFAYLKVLEHIPNDTDSLFELGYCSAQADLSSVSAYFYSKLISFSPDNGTAFNNLSVAYERLGLKYNSYQMLKKAVELGRTIAASNLANSYIYLGFKEEAEQILNKAIASEDVDPEVWYSKERLNKELEDEDKKHKELLKVEEWHRLFFRKYADNYFLQTKLPVPAIDGPWLFMKDVEIEPMNVDGETSFEFFGESKKTKDKIVLRFESVIGTATWNRQVDVPPYGGYSNEYKGYALYDSESNTILILAIYKREVLTCELMKDPLKALA